MDRPRIDRRCDSALPQKLSDFVGPDHDEILALDNPFPADNQLHDEFEDRRRRAAAEAAALWRRLIEEPSHAWGDVIVRVVDWWSGVFDLRAAMWLLPMAPSVYALLIDSHALVILAHVKQQDLPIGDELVPALRRRLRQQRAYWMAKADAADVQIHANDKAAVLPSSKPSGPPPARTPSKPDAPIPDLVSIATAADHLGVHEDTIRRMKQRGEIWTVKVGKRVQVPRTELARLCQTGDYPKRRP